MKKLLSRVGVVTTCAVAAAGLSVAAPVSAHATTARAASAPSKGQVQQKCWKVDSVHWMCIL